MKYFRNIRLRYKAGLVAVLVLFVYMKGCIHGQREEQRKLPPQGILKQDEVGQALIYPLQHKITFVTRKGVTQHFLPDGPSKLTLKTDGTVIINIPTWGLELRPFAGGVISDRLRYEFGIDFLYWNRFNAGACIQGAAYNYPLNAALHVSYNFWANIYGALSVDNHKQPGFALGIRF